MKKIIVMFILTLLIATTILPVVSTMNIEKDDIELTKPDFSSTDVVWSENFDSYSLGQLLDGTPDDGGWILYNDGHSSPIGAYIVDDQSLSSPHSVEIAMETDILHEFTGINSGHWTFRDWVYVPNEHETGFGGIFLGSYYKPGEQPTRYWHVGVGFFGKEGMVYDLYGGNNLPIITDQWVELRVELNLEDDWCETYYNDELLTSGKWTDMGLGGGYRNLGGVDLSWCQSPIYHDNFSIQGATNGLEPNLESYGSLNWIDVKPGSIITDNFTIENIGDPGSRLEWIVDEYPDFGLWTIKPKDGSLKPEDGPVTVNVTVVAPDRKNKEFTGQLKLSVIGNPSDSCTIDVVIKTSKIKSIYCFDNWKYILIEKFPMLLQLLLKI